MIPEYYVSSEKSQNYSLRNSLKPIAIVMGEVNQILTNLSSLSLFKIIYQDCNLGHIATLAPIIGYACYS